MFIFLIAGALSGGCVGYLWAFLKYRKKTVQPVLPEPQIPLPQVPVPAQVEEEAPLPPRAAPHAAPAARRRGARLPPRGPHVGQENIITTHTGDK